VQKRLLWSILICFIQSKKRTSKLFFSSHDCFTLFKNGQLLLSFVWLPKSNFFGAKVNGNFAINLFYFMHFRFVQTDFVDVFCDICELTVLMI